MDKLKTNKKAKKSSDSKRVLTEAEVEEYLQFSIALASVDGSVPSKEAQEITRRYLRGEIDYKTAEREIIGLYKK